MRTCSIEGCEKTHRARGYCMMHLGRIARTGEPGPAESQTPRRGPNCSVGGCPERHLALGYCKKHYRAFRSTGDPLVKQPYMTSAREAGSYKTMHGKLRYWRGPAKNHPCANCGAPEADHWSYDHKDLDEQRGLIPDQRGKVREVPWSKKTEHYQPLCKTCHLKRDLDRT